MIVVQGDHDLLFSRAIEVTELHWIGSFPDMAGSGFRCKAKVRYRQPDQDCRLVDLSNGRIRVEFTTPQRAVAPGQYAVFYAGDRCLGGGVIDRLVRDETGFLAAV